MQYLLMLLKNRVLYPSRALVVYLMVLIARLFFLGSYVRTAMFVLQVLPVPFKPLEWATRTPVRELVVFPLSNGEGSGDVYRIPGGKKRAGVLVFLGIIPVPKNDHRVVNLCNALARSGFVAMFPWSTSMMAKRIKPDESDNLVRAFQYLQNLEYVDPARVGMVGFCVGSSISTVAASDPRINGDVSFLSAFGGYYNLADMVAQVASHNSFDGSTVEPWEANHLTVEVLTNQLIQGLSEGNDKRTLETIFVEGADPEGQGVDELSTEGKLAYRILESTASQDGAARITLEEAQHLVQSLAPGFQSDVAAVSPEASIGNLKAKVMIAHDREDNLVPVEESRRLADALSNRGNVKLTEFSFFSHVTPDKHVGPRTFMVEALKVFRYVYSMIRVAS